MIQLEHRGLLIVVAYSCEPDGDDEQFAVIRWRIVDPDEVESADKAVIRLGLMRDRDELREMAREAWLAECEMENDARAEERIEMSR